MFQTQSAPKSMSAAVLFKISWRSLQCYPDPQAGFLGMAYLKRNGRKGRGKERKGMMGMKEGEGWMGELSPRVHGVDRCPCVHLNVCYGAISR